MEYQLFHLFYILVIFTILFIVCVWGGAACLCYIVGTKQGENIYKIVNDVYLKV